MFEGKSGGTRIFMIALMAIFLDACSIFPSDNWFSGPTFVDDSQSAWLYGLIEGKPIAEEGSYWRVKIPRSEVPEEVWQAFKCENADQYSQALILAGLYADNRRYTFVSDAGLVGSLNGGPSSVFYYTDGKAFSVVKQFLLKNSPKDFKPAVAKWRMSKPNCAQ